MAASRNNGGGSKNHLPLQLQDGSPYRHAYYNKNDEITAKERKITLIAWAAAAVTMLLLWFLCCCLHKRAVEQGAGGGNRVRPPRQRGEAGGRVVDRAPSVAVAAVELAADPPLVCTYRKADGWGEGSCAVCLEELADGEALRVLPACMHYFHADCVDEWLRAHDTCPLCRAPLGALAAAA